jgi:hypothetical protein
MNGKILITVNNKIHQLWFNNFSKAELSKMILPKKDGFPAKPEEFPLISALTRLLDESYLSLMRDIIYSGIMGNSFATNKIPTLSIDEVSEFIATEREDNLYNVWECYLEAMGVNIDNIKDKIKNENDHDPDDSKKKMMA